MNKAYCLCLLLSLTAIATSDASVIKRQFKKNNAILKVEILSDKLVHTEYSVGELSGKDIYTSPLIFNKNYSGPSSFLENGTTLNTPSLEITVDIDSLCIRFDNSEKQTYMTTLCPSDMNQDQKQLYIDSSNAENAYGLGEQFKKPGSADGDWVSHGSRDSRHLGNGFETFLEAAVGNIQIPILYGVGDNNTFGLLLDNVYKQDWNFRGDWWNVTTYGSALRAYVFAGDDLKSVRSDYLNLTGKPPVPPKKTFGLWLSKFGYHGWEEIDYLKENMRAKGYPFEGFVLDVNWFGGIVRSRPDLSRMGELEWDQSNTDGNSNYFPDVENRLKNYANENINFTLIEESYVVESSNTFKNLHEKKLFNFDREYGSCNPDGSRNPKRLEAWWGNGGMIDWSNPGAGKWIHDNKRYKNMVALGVTNHWTDLGEPEMYDETACYQGVEDGNNDHKDIHNIYNLLWSQSIWDGYKRHNYKNNKRPFIMTRSGSAGTQRFGAGVWSADIGSNLQSLATHMNAHMHMSLSGIDYFSNDTGGFRKETMPGNDKSGRYLGYEDEIYTMWYANSSLLDIPLRPHTDNDFSSEEATSPNWKPYKTAPFLVGKDLSNKMNTWQRYELIPYYYSLGYRAHYFGEAVMPPMVYMYQDDKRFRTMGHQKMIGPNLMVGIVASHGEFKRDIVLPRGGWFNYHTNEYFNGDYVSQIRNVPVYIDGVLRLPLFAKAGSILPKMEVTDETADVFGHNKNGGINENFMIQVYEGPTSEFYYYEDDGKTLSFNQDGTPVYDTQWTYLKQVSEIDNISVTISSRDGEQVNTNFERHNIVKLITNNKRVNQVRVNGQELSQKGSKQELDRSTSGWVQLLSGEIIAKTQKLSVSTEKIFTFSLQNKSLNKSSLYLVCKNGWTVSGENIVVIDESKSLSDSNIIKLDPSVYYEYIWNPSPVWGESPGPKSPVWTKLLTDVKSDFKGRLSCAKLNSSGEITSRTSAKLVQKGQDTFSLFESSL